MHAHCAVAHTRGRKKSAPHLHSPGTPLGVTAPRRDAACCPCRSPAKPDLPAAIVVPVCAVAEVRGARPALRRSGIDGHPPQLWLSRA